MKAFTVTKRHITSLPAKALSLARKKPLVLIVIILVLAGVSLASATAPSAVKEISKKKDTAKYQGELQNAVDSSTGAPRSGRDPASQSQNSLASAASKPDGPGMRTDKPAANVSGDHSHHHQPNNDTAQTGVTAAGCIVGYGKPGEQCLPTPGGSKPVTCEYVHSKGFHHGIKVTGEDKHHLDKNHDGTACGHGD